jgi:hypothetical protein
MNRRRGIRRFVRGDADLIAGILDVARRDVECQDADTVSFHNPVLVALHSASSYVHPTGINTARNAQHLGAQSL